MIVLNAGVRTSTAFWRDWYTSGRTSELHSRRHLLTANRPLGSCHPYDPVTEPGAACLSLVWPHPRRMPTLSASAAPFERETWSSWLGPLPLTARVPSSAATTHTRRRKRLCTRSAWCSLRQAPTCRMLSRRGCTSFAQSIGSTSGAPTGRSSPRILRRRRWSSSQGCSTHACLLRSKRSRISSCDRRRPVLLLVEEVKLRSKTDAQPVGETPTISSCTTAVGRAW